MQSDNPIIRFFTWWNGAMADPDQLLAEGFGAHFAPDAQLIVNGNVRATSLAEMAVHYRAIADRLDLVEMVLPVEEEFTTDSRAFVHCRTRAELDNTKNAEEAMAYAVVDGDRMRLLRVVSLSV
ncbi:hypothetical protein [Sphingobium cloacae]|uniref:SnoaL-like domain-containing protein n=1 Tax=Sphingobium cloacae TaxID=120107 RepID=A0A1E1EXU0_9SPHN|nr:hypothetical protein [Sphingobium cloacae]BAV63085.1 hypothetical protein SCLO_1000450 [Sphingobium cloacae]